MDISNQKSAEKPIAKNLVDAWNRAWRTVPEKMNSSVSLKALKWSEADLTKVEQTLDVGCGEYGTSWILGLDDAKRHVINLDLSSVALRSARKIELQRVKQQQEHLKQRKHVKRQKGHKGSASDHKEFLSEYVQGSATNLPFRNESFDMVTAFDTIPLLGNAYMYALREMWRVTDNHIIFNVTYKGMARDGFISLDENELADMLAAFSSKPTMQTFTLGEIYDQDLSMRISPGGDKKADIFAMLRKKETL
jgi:SAM-dependent methyltransferase